MTSKSDRRGGALAALGILALIAFAFCSPLAYAAEEQLGIELDRATLLKLPEKVTTIVIGNPAIADVTVQSGGLAVVTGKGYGTTNLIALDRAGATLMERSIVVRGASKNTVSVYRGMGRETYSCAPDCERRITLGDSGDYFTATVTQTDVRNNQAAAGARGPNR
jgi:Flp pilus assembly secretin CpaC